MRRSLRILTLALLVPAAATLTPAGLALRQAQTAQDVLKAEAERVRALTGNDLAALERLLADDLTYTHSSGLADDKEQFLAALDFDADVRPHLMVLSRPRYLLS